VGNLVLIF
jgi:O-acetylhomoserine/O-acetylserine sulfhydrylase